MPCCVRHANRKFAQDKGGYVVRLRSDSDKYSAEELLEFIKSQLNIWLDTFSTPSELKYLGIFKDKKQAEAAQHIIDGRSLQRTHKTQQSRDIPNIEKFINKKRISRFQEIAKMRAKA